MKLVNIIENYMTKKYLQQRVSFIARLGLNESFVIFC
jgi:hypothetical protein